MPKIFSDHHDGGYRFSDQHDGVFLLPHANLDLRGSGLVGRVGAGPALLFGSKSQVGLVVKITLGFGRSY